MGGSTKKSRFSIIKISLEIKYKIYAFIKKFKPFTDCLHFFFNSKNLAIYIWIYLKKKWWRQVKSLLCCFVAADIANRAEIQLIHFVAGLIDKSAVVKARVCQARGEFVMWQYVCDMTRTKGNETMNDR